MRIFADSLVIGSKIKVQKIKVTFNSLARELESLIDNQSLRSVQEYVFLGHIATGDPDNGKEIYKMDC